MFDSLKPGSPVSITITSAPRSEGQKKTLSRLMKMSADNRRSMAAGQETRRRTTPIAARGGRGWAVRPTIAKLVEPKPSATWTLTWRPQLAADLASVQEFISVKPA